MIPRRTLLRTSILAPLATPMLARGADAKTLIVAEPQHGIGYLPLYVAIRKGFFEREGLTVKILTVEAAAAHTNAVLSGQAYAFIGGPEHNAFAKLKGAELRAVANVVNRGNLYLVAKTGSLGNGDDLATTLRGKSLATGFYGGTPHSISRYLCLKAGLKLGEDVKLVETLGAGALAAVRAGTVNFATTTEPLMTQGIRNGIWTEPFFNVPKRLGAYAYSTLNIRRDSIEKDKPATEAFARGVIAGLQATYADPAEAASIAKLEFPTMPLEDMKATLDRSFADELWSHDGRVSEQAWTTAQDVVLSAGVLKQPVPYADIIDMSFIRNA
jgi:NitT/TauT family transport system substrate-binding protein